ncbi:hypothetical protein FQA39_LY12231 [Lamprigera yunnana]|nr:hypothetical protein FQA39_LY12231 [Lamprigera yunnana]
MYKLLLVTLSIKMVFCSIIIPEEQTPIRKCVQHLISNWASPDHVVVHAYFKENSFSLDMIQNPKIIIDVEKRIFNLDNYKTYMEMIIVDVQNMYGFFNFFGRIDDYKEFTDPRAILRKKHLITIPDINIEIVKKIIYELFHLDIIDLIVMTYNHSSNTPIRLFKLNPYNWANKCGEVIAAVEEYTCNTINTIRRPGILDKYGNCTLNYLIPNPKSLTKDMDERSYMSYFVANIIEETLNLTLHPIENSKIRTFGQFNDGRRILHVFHKTGVPSVA